MNCFDLRSRPVCIIMSSGGWSQTLISVYSVDIIQGPPWMVIRLTSLSSQSTRSKWAYRTRCNNSCLYGWSRTLLQENSGMPANAYKQSIITAALMYVLFSEILSLFFFLLMEVVKIGDLTSALHFDVIWHEFVWICPMQLERVTYIDRAATGTTSHAVQVQSRLVIYLTIQLLS